MLSTIVRMSTFLRFFTRSWVVSLFLFQKRCQLFGRQASYLHNAPSEHMALSGIHRDCSNPFLRMYSPRLMKAGKFRPSKPIQLRPNPSRNRSNPPLKPVIETDQITLETGQLPQPSTTRSDSHSQSWSNSGTPVKCPKNWSKSLKTGPFRNLSNPIKKTNSGQVL